jgi:hypothetical protein
VYVCHVQSDRRHPSFFFKKIFIFLKILNVPQVNMIIIKSQHDYNKKNFIEKSKKSLDISLIIL